MNDKLNTDGWETLFETTHGTVYFADDDIIITVPKPGIDHNEKISSQQLERLHGFIQHRGRRCGYCVVVDSVANQSAGARTQWQTQLNPDLVFGIGLIASTELAQMISKFFEGTNQSTIPTKCSDSVVEILDWLRTLREDQGGPLGNN